MSKQHSGGIATGLVLAVIGVWLILRTVTKNDEDQNLVDKILGGGSTEPQPLFPEGSGADVNPATNPDAAGPIDRRGDVNPATNPNASGPPAPEVVDPAIDPTASGPINPGTHPGRRHRHGGRRRRQGRPVG
jgi:hypothetical protein